MRNAILFYTVIDNVQTTTKKHDISLLMKKKIPYF